MVRVFELLAPRDREQKKGVGDGERQTMRACLALLLNSGTSRNESGKHTAYWSSSLEDAARANIP